MTIDVYMRYYAADCLYGGVKRRGAKVTLTSDSEKGHIRYDVTVTFFPHADDEDFGISYDAYGSETVYDADGRRSKKREKELLSGLEETADRIAGKLEGKIFWDRPLCEARLG